jgi:hypothetical protein
LQGANVGVRGGLGVLDLTTLGYALRLRWEWLSRMEPERLWVALPRKQEAIVQAMFRASVTVQVGMGNAALFWRNRWLDGSAIADFAPDVSAAVSPRLRRARTVAGALVNMQWIRDDSGSLSTQALSQYVVLWERIQGVQLIANVEDRFVWKWTATQQYSAASAYRAFFHDQCGLPVAWTLAKTLTPARCKFFIWLSLLGRCWTSARLQRRNLQNSDPCILCSQADELMPHLMMQCVFSGEVWFQILRAGGFQHLAPMLGEQWPDWWLRRRKQVQKDHRKGSDTMVVLIAWRLWKERNQRVFDQVSVQAPQLAVAILEEGRTWLQAGFQALVEWLHA